MMNYVAKCELGQLLGRAFTSYDRDDVSNRGRDKSPSAKSMAPKEPTKHQLSARLSYSQHTPAFLRKLQSRVSGLPDENSDENPEFEDDGSGRPPIPRRPPIPERPASDPGSEDEDRDDEAPQVVVLKEGKHLSAREVENERRKAKGLPPLPDPVVAALPLGDTKDSQTKKHGAKDMPVESLSFSSGPPSSSRRTTSKRKVVGDGRAEEDTGLDASTSKGRTKKKPKVGLSFADDA
ncbi:hypothetical protein BJV78DRAFT_86245 [Lactifluus subvellereus]|nr:hypothetical protein BJV78DRAFT_86245 [Lactifluus subvellereus]